MALGIANSASAAKHSRAGVWATKPLLMPVLAAFAVVVAGDGKKDMRLPATGMALSGLGDIALLGPESWFVPGMAAFAAVPRQESAVMPTYVAAQFLLAAGYLSPQRASGSLIRAGIGSRHGDSARSDCDECPG
ncbi:MAG: YhhN family [Actinomycetia bacterium]|nr:YhhN family [Actinomycetes bacterium]